MRRVIATFLAITLLAPPLRAAEIRFDGTGLVSIQVKAQEILHAGRPRAAFVVLEETYLNESGIKKYKFEKRNEAPKKSTFDAPGRTLLQEYSWGTVAYQYRPGDDRLDLAVVIRNATQATLADFSFTLMELTLPYAPADWHKGQGGMRNSLDNLALLRVECGDQALLACNLTMDPPMHFGFGKAKSKTGDTYPLEMRGGIYIPEAGAYHVEPHGLPRVAPGKERTLEVTLRFADKSVPAAKALADVYERFREFYQPNNRWDDRRPIAMIIHSNPYKGNASKSNPRGWLGNPKLDGFTPQGKADFRTQMLKAAEQSVRVIKETGAQGMIFWDIEGQENPHPISYIGDPRLAAKLAPEMDEIADAYFKIYRDAGLRTGVCIRPSQLYFDEKTKKWSHGTGSDGGPGRGSFYTDLKPKDLPWYKFYPVVERLSDRIDYAKKRWGCTLFYIDTNGVFRQVGEDEKFHFILLNAQIWKEIKKRHPEVLLIPELYRSGNIVHAANWAYTASYMQLDQKMYGTPSYVRDLLPGAFGVLNVAEGDVEKHREAIRSAVRNGDILMFRGWFNDKRNAFVKSMNSEVTR